MCSLHPLFTPYAPWLPLCLFVPFLTSFSPSFPLSCPPSQAMGANIINTIAEGLAPSLVALLGG